jgi:SNF2 family DNA or RNA helicase
MIQLLEEYLVLKGTKFEKITGDVKSLDRQAAIDRFNDSKKSKSVFLLSTKAGG